MNTFTYEAGIDEALHPDQNIHERMIELAKSDCIFGCWLYEDPFSELVVLGHSIAYDCKRTRKDIWSGKALVTEFDWPDSSISERRRMQWAT